MQGSAAPSVTRLTEGCRADARFELSSSDDVAAVLGLKHFWKSEQCSASGASGLEMPPAAYEHQHLNCRPVFAEYYNLRGYFLVSDYLILEGLL